jgi:hypothetical protein
MNTWRTAITWMLAGYLVSMRPALADTVCHVYSGGSQVEAIVWKRGVSIADSTIGCVHASA